MKTKCKPVNSQKSFGFREQLRIGGEIAAALPQKMSQTLVAKSLGISQQMVSRIERRALFKLRAFMLERRKEVVSNALPEVADRPKGFARPHSRYGERL